MSELVMIASIFNKCIFEFLETAKNIINAIIAIIMKRTVNTIWYFFLKYVQILEILNEEEGVGVNVNWVFGIYIVSVSPIFLKNQYMQHANKHHYIMKYLNFDHFSWLIQLY